MAKGYSVRYARNYYRGKDGKWKLHSSSCWDANGYTRTWATVEAAEAYAKELMAKTIDPESDRFIRYCKVYLGKEMVKVVNR